MMNLVSLISYKNENVYELFLKKSKNSVTFVSLSFGANRECVIPVLLVESLMNLVSVIPD